LRWLMVASMNKKNKVKILVQPKTTSHKEFNMQ
jgi:hypothetical protein